MNLDYLKETYQLSQTEVQILSYLDRGYMSLNDLSIRDAAKACFTSPSSIIRLAKKLNLSGYNELVYKIRESHLLVSAAAEIMPSEDTIHQFCKLLEKNRNNLIMVLGSGFSAHISAYISEVLNFHSIPNVTTAHTQLINSRKNQNILFVFVSHSGEEAALKETISLARKGKNTIISFLGTRQSTLAEQSDLVLSSDSYSPFSTGIAQPQLFFGRTLIIFESLICAYINSMNQESNNFTYYIGNFEKGE